MLHMQWLTLRLNGMQTSAPRFTTCKWNHALHGSKYAYPQKVNLHIISKAQQWHCAYLMDPAPSMHQKTCPCLHCIFNESSTIIALLIPPYLSTSHNDKCYGNSTIQLVRKNLAKQLRNWRMLKQLASLELHSKPWLPATCDMSTNMPMTFSLAQQIMSNGTAANVCLSPKVAISQTQTNGEEQCWWMYAPSSSALSWMAVHLSF